MAVDSTLPTKLSQDYYNPNFGSTSIDFDLAKNKTGLGNSLRDVCTLANEFAATRAQRRSVLCHRMNSTAKNVEIG